MDDAFKIYVEQLRDGHIEKIEESFLYDILDVHDKDLDYQDNIDVKGEAYLAEDNLILKLNVSTLAVLPCTICNDPVKVEVKIEGLYHAVPISEIKGAVFNFKEILREAVILETPAFAECKGNCPHRKEVGKYLKKAPPKGEGKSDDEGYQPFSDLQWDKKKK